MGHLCRRKPDKDDAYGNDVDKLLSGNFNLSFKRIHFLQATLQFSEAGGKKSIVSYLVSKGAEVNDMDNVGLTPLDTAALRGNAVAAAELLSCEGIYKEVTNTSGG